MKPIITFDDFAKLDLRVGTVVDCIDVEKSEKLLKLTVDFGEEGTKTIFSGIKQWYQPDELKDKQFIFVINLEPRKMMNEFSEGMLLATDGEKPEPLKAISEVPAGTTIL
jgi:methionyl-tRNA synthetase